MPSSSGSGKIITVNYEVGSVFGVSRSAIPEAIARLKADKSYQAARALVPLLPRPKAQMASRLATTSETSKATATPRGAGGSGRGRGVQTAAARTSKPRRSAREHEGRGRRASSRPAGRSRPPLSPSHLYRLDQSILRRVVRLPRAASPIRHHPDAPALVGEAAAPRQRPGGSEMIFFAINRGTPRRRAPRPTSTSSIRRSGSRSTPTTYAAPR